MSKQEIALQITLALIEKGNFYFPSKPPKDTGKEAAEMYNAILAGLKSGQDQSAC